MPKFKVGEKVFFYGTKILYKIISVREKNIFPSGKEFVYEIHPHKKNTAKGIIPVESPEEYLTHA